MSINTGHYSDVQALRASQVLFRKNLRYLLEMRSLSPSEVSRETGVSSLPRYAGYFEYDVNPSLRTIFILANYFHVNPGDLIGKDLEAERENYDSEELFWYDD